MKFSHSLVICLILFLAISVFPQSDREKGIQFYKTGNYQSAITFLESVTKLDKKDADAWNVLGMAYLGISKYKESRKALENAVKQNPQNAAFNTNLAYSNLLANKLSNAEKAIQKAIALDSKSATALYLRGVIFSQKGKFENAIDDANSSINIDKSLEVAYSLKSNSYLYKFGQCIANGKKFSEGLGLLQNSIEALETCLVNCSQPIMSANQTKLEELKAFYQYFSKHKDDNFSSITKPTANSANIPIPPVDPSITPLNITAKPKASYTDPARQAGVQGTISLAVLFSADGHTKMILVIKPLSNGLTEEAIKAAQRIKFDPQMKDGKPVSVVKLLQYTFTMY